MSENPVNSAIVHATEANFDTVIAGSPLVLVKLGAAWCGPCRMMGPYIELFARLYNGKALVVEVDSDQAPALSERFGVNGIPHVVVIRDGAAAENFAGFAGDEMREQVRTLLFGSDAGDGQSEAEVAFAALAASAEADYETASAAAKSAPEVLAFDKVYKPRALAYRVAVTAAQEDLNGGNIDQATFDERVAALKKPLQEFQQTAEFQELMAGYQAVQLRGETAYIAAITAAVEQSFPLPKTAPATAGDASTGTVSGAVCEIGDPTCHS